VEGLPELRQAAALDEQLLGLPELVELLKDWPQGQALPAQALERGPQQELVLLPSL
jgi:hypothetical protein